jgi:deoxyribodipyrimidine photo-lyase
VNRDIPSLDGTSKLSPHLAFGEISSRDIYDQYLKLNKKNIGCKKFINEIGWREFAYHLINHFPHMKNKNLRKNFDKFPWSTSKTHLQKWKKGETGYPIVDAAMKQLYETGWMHNRLRMVTGSFLVKHLRINWVEGEKYFQDTLLDYDAANNVAGWQWIAGCGADAAPYFRIFNPMTQGEKFDKNGDFVRKWLPKLKTIPNKYIHKPWEMPKEISKLINFDLKRDYFEPIVDHSKARNEALKAFEYTKK